jgi:alanyl-tRNA synthetase
LIGGKGGGKENQAQAAGKETGNVTKAIEQATQFANNILSQ